MSLSNSGPVETLLLCLWFKILPRTRRSLGFYLSNQKFRQNKGSLKGKGVEN